MVPKLRFKEFCGEWEEKRLGDIAEIYKGNTLSKSDLRDEGYPCILYGELYTKYGEIIERVYSKTNRADKNLFIGKNNDVLIPSSGETAIDISTASCLKCDNVYIGGDLNVIRCNDINGSFLSYNLNHKQKNSIAKFAQGVSVVHIYGDSLRKLKIKIPSLPEQTKIADFLSTVDDKIQNQQDKITHLENIKNGFMQKIFSRKIRFKDDGGEEFPEWEEKKLGDFLIKYDEITVKNNQYPPITSSRRGIFLQKYYFNNRQIASEDNTGYNIVPFGYFTYRHMSDDAVFYFNINNLVEYGIVSTLYPVFTTTKKMNSIFLQYYLNESTTFKKYCILQKQGGSRTYMYFNKLKQFIMENPCLKEQQKIADFLSLFDEKISTEKETLEHLEQLKKGLLQQMFV